MRLRELKLSAEIPTNQVCLHRYIGHIICKLWN